MLQNDYALVEPKDIEDCEFYFVRLYGCSFWTVARGIRSDSSEFTYPGAPERSALNYRGLVTLPTLHDIDADLVDEIRGPIKKPGAFLRPVSVQSWKQTQ
jgi:hypothetical protein